MNVPQPHDHEFSVWLWMEYTGLTQFMCSMQIVFSPFFVERWPAGCEEAQHAQLN